MIVPGSRCRIQHAGLAKFHGDTAAMMDTTAFRSIVSGSSNTFSLANAVNRNAH